MGCSHSSAQVKSSRRSRRMLPRLPRSHLDLPQQELLSLAIEFLRFSQTFVVNNLPLLQLQGGQGLLLQLCELTGQSSARARSSWKVPTWAIKSASLCLNLWTSVWSSWSNWVIWASSTAKTQKRRKPGAKRSAAMNGNYAASYFTWAKQQLALHVFTCTHDLAKTAHLRSGILILSDIFSDVLSGHLFWHSTWHMLGSRRAPLPVELAIWLGPNGAHSHQDKLAGGDEERSKRKRQREEGRVAPLSKSKDPRLAGGKYLLDLTQMLWMPRVSYPLVMFIVRMFYPESTSCNVHSRKDILEDQKQHVSSKAAMRTCSTTDKRQSLFSYCTTTLFRMQYPYQKEALLQRGAFFFWRSFPAHVHTQKV